MSAVIHQHWSVMSNYSWKMVIMDQPVVPIDQFPQTPHVESVTVLVKD